MVTIKKLGELVPVNCFGLSNMSAVMNRVSLLEMTESDVDQYFSLLYRVLANKASDRPVPVPTPQQNAAAVSQPSRSVVAELGGDQTDIERFVFYASNPSKATPSDMCWATRVTLHAIIAMPDPERDIVLLRTTTPEGSHDAPPAQQSGTPDTARPLPASSQPDSADAR